MTKQLGLAHNGTPEQPLKIERVRACSIALSSGSSLLGNLEWSELGQALVVTNEAIIVLSPLVGLNPTLAGQSRTQDVECHPSWQDRFPHSVAQVNIKTFLEHETSVRRRILLESDHSSIDARFLSAQWCSASWSKPGMGPHQSCLILATSSELDLFVLGAPHNAWTGEWKLLQAVSLDPVSASVKYTAAPPPRDNDKGVFTRPRALLRKQQMATEVICASWINLEVAARRHADASEPLQLSHSSSTYIVAGTRSGHIGIWECAAVSGHCTFVSTTSVGSTGIERLLVSTHVGTKATNKKATIAFQDADGVRLCDVVVVEGRAHVQLSKSPPISTEHYMLTAWRWYKDLLVYSTIGKMHVYDTKIGRSRTILLGTEPDSGFDPYAPTICISISSGPQNIIHVVRQDLREYRISLVQAEQAQPLPNTVRPIYPPSLTGYPPLTEVLQRKHDGQQAFVGYASDISSQCSAASIVGAVRTNERLAFLGYNVSENLCYQMELIRCGDMTPSSLLAEALNRVASGTRPYLAVRIVLTLLYTREQQDVFRDQLVLAVEKSWTALAGASAIKNQQSGQATTQKCALQQQLLYLLACRLQDTSSGASAQFESLQKTHRDNVRRSWLEEHASASAVTTEQCAACETPLAASGDEDPQGLGWARCQNGHVWPRCSVSLATISDRKVRVCTGCWAKAIVPDKPGQSFRQACILKTATKCLYCGSCWIVR